MSKLNGRIVVFGMLAFLVAAVVVTRLSVDRGFETLDVANVAQLQDALAGPRERLNVVLAPGEYHLVPAAAIDSTCGNCEDSATLVPVTVGLRVSGKQVWILGPDRGEATICTHAGYGVYFDRCEDCGIAGVTITGGERDTSREATDAAVVVKRSTVSVFHNRIEDNIGDSTLVAAGVVGIMGICGREESFAWIRDNDIVRNSWDGIALYRGAEAEIELNLIDGIDRARGKEAGGGRGVGVGVTWDARAKIKGNIVKRYWKGIGVFVDAHAVVQQNIVEEMLAWGIAVWDADRGSPWAFIEDNVVYDCGACGVSITRSAPFAPEESPGGFTGNVVVKTGQDPRYDSPDYYCYQCALALHAVPDRFAIADNLFFDNRRASDDLFDADVTEKEFRRKKGEFLDRVLVSREDWVFQNSSFLERYADD